MAASDDFSSLLEGFSGTARLFPLPGVKLFPHVLQPFHIFEPRYRSMLEEALADDGLIAVATLAPGWESDYQGRPPLYPTACLGRITSHKRLATGSYNILILGIQRVRLVRELPPDKLFREAVVEVFSDAYPATSVADLQRQLYDGLREVLPYFAEVREQLEPILAGDVPLGVLSDIVGFMLDLPVAEKQTLLSERNVHRRAEHLLRLLAAVRHDQEPGRSGESEFPPPFSEN